MNRKVIKGIHKCVDIQWYEFRFSFALAMRDQTNATILREFHLLCDFQTDETTFNCYLK